MERNIAPRISKDNLEKIIIKFIKSYYTDREVLDIINNFDIDYELNEFYSKYLDYFDIDDDTIFLNDNVSIKMLEGFIVPESDEDINFLENVIDFLNSDLSITELMGITIRKDIYDYLIKIYKSLNEQYKDSNDLKPILRLAKEKNVPIVYDNVIKCYKVFGLIKNMADA